MMNNDEDNRPSPEVMLRLAQAEEKEEGRGKLKIFLGYAAGVGKTFAMLEAAWQRRLEERDVVAAYVESHGRFETDSLLAGLEIIPKAHIEYMGVQLPELDIDAVLARKPQIALVDELAHTNAPGSRHEKRWQDVEELLAAGIDVYTTVNIQHMESLNDIVAQITGVVVRETVPDRLLDEATEIRLVDIPPEELLQRLHEGKIYIPEQAAQAMQKFFTTGNLIALRELSLRRTAACVDEEMRAYMEARALPGPRSVAERLMVCVSGSPFSEKLIRSTRRLADEIKAPWVTVYIETPGSGRQLQENRARVWKDLRFAEMLGAEVATVTATSVADAAVEYAKKHDITKIVVGKPKKPWWRDFLRQPLVDQIIRLSGTIDVYVVSIESAEKKAPPATVRKTGPEWSGYLTGTALVAGATIIGELVRPFLVPTNLVMIYLLAVVIASVRLGLKPAIATVFLSVLAFDFFLVPPRLTFAVADTEYLITFVALFTVGVVISSLVAKAKDRAEVVREREVQTASLYYLSRDLAAAADVDAIVEALVKNIGESLDARTAILLPVGDRLQMAGTDNDFHFGMKELAVADWAFRNRQAAGKGTETLGSTELLCLILQSPGKPLGIMAVKLKSLAEYTSPQTRRLLDAFATQTAMALERVQLNQQAEQAQILRAKDNFERALLNSVSHDLRTPLVSITGALSTLREEESNLHEAARHELIKAALEEAERLNRFVGNLLDMSRLEAGELKIKEEPINVEELAGCALASLGKRLEGRNVDIDIPAGLPLVQMDLVLMTQVLVNLLDNAIKYSPLGSPLEIASQIKAKDLVVSVADHGPGVPEEDLNRIFGKFYRAPVPERTGGTGLGLSICKGIVEAHGGAISAENRDGGGLKVVVKLPLQ